MTLPTVSLTNDTTGNVVTGISLTNAEDGEFTETKENVGSLALTGYASTTSSISNMPSATDSINTAVSKLSYLLDNENTTVNTRLNNMGSKNLASSGVSIMPVAGANTPQTTRTFGD